MFDRKMSFLRAIDEATATKILGPLANDELCEATRVTGSVNVSNRNSVKLISVLTQFFHPMKGVDINY
jgi:hypothetical protein